MLTLPRTCIRRGTRAPGQIYAGLADILLIAQRWTRLLQGREEEIRRAMHARRWNEVHTILERVKVEARGIGEVGSGLKGGELRSPV